MITEADIEVFMSCKYCVQGHTRYTCMHTRMCICREMMAVVRGSADSVLCALNSDAFTVTYAKGPGYIDHRTFNLITYIMYSAWWQGMLLQ